MLDTAYPFDTNNRAYQRFLTLAGEHFEVVGWNNASTGRPAMDTTSVGLVLLDRDRAQLAVVGPFPTPDDAQAWQPDADGWPAVDRLTVALHPPAPEAA
ncbi:hypothetical protein [Micromonospora sp. NPDC005113]